MQRQAGIGLVEIMISLVLGLMVTGAIVQIYLTTKRQNEMQTSLTGRQESARFAAQLIQRDAQMAGFRGCLRDLGTVTNTLNNANNFLYNFGQHVIGFNNAGGLPASITNVVPNTDVLTLRTVDDPGISLTAGMASNTGNPVTVAGLAPAPLANGDMVLVADCSGATVFQVNTYNAGTGAIEHITAGTPGNSTLNLGRRFAAGAQVFRLRTTTYYIRESANGTGPALWRRVGLEAPQELAEGIENMQVLYGEDTDGDQSPDIYRTATAVVDWRQVVSLQVGLLAAGTQDRVADADTRTFNLLDEVIDPSGGDADASDGRLRRVVTFTVAMRNRLS
ncbi:MAG: PilW family protein [Gammaproteobacteria bacterium]|nr:PilW family protein [Gammaproteobacteria bacterium]